MGVVVGLLRGLSRATFFLAIGAGIAIGYLGWELRPEWPLVRAQWITMGLGAFVVVSELARGLLLAQGWCSAVTYFLFKGLAAAATGAAAVLVFVERDIVLDDIVDEDDEAAKNAVDAAAVREHANDALVWGKWLLVGAGALQVFTLLLPFIVKALDRSQRYSSLDGQAHNGANTTDAYHTLKIEMEPIHNPKTPRFKRPGSAKQVPKPVYHTAADGGAVRMFGNPVAEGAPSEGSESSTSSDP